MIIYSPRFPSISTGTAVWVAEDVYRIEGALIPPGAVALPNWYHGALIASQVAAAKRAEINAAKADALTRAIGSDTGIRYAMADADALVYAATQRPLTAAEAAQLAVYQAAKDVADLINAKQDALLAAIDEAELAGNLDALLAIAWEE